jgi:hypothetical protein
MKQKSHNKTSQKDKNINQKYKNINQKYKNINQKYKNINQKYKNINQKDKNENKTKTKKGLTTDDFAVLRSALELVASMDVNPPQSPTCPIATSEHKRSKNVESSKHRIEIDSTTVNHGATVKEVKALLAGIMAICSRAVDSIDDVQRQRALAALRDLCDTLKGLNHNTTNHNINDEKAQIKRALEIVSSHDILSFDNVSNEKKQGGPKSYKERVANGVRRIAFNAVVTMTAWLTYVFVTYAIGGATLIIATGGSFLESLKFPFKELYYAFKFIPSVLTLPNIVENCKLFLGYIAGPSSPLQYSYDTILEKSKEQFPILGIQVGDPVKLTYFSFVSLFSKVIAGSNQLLFAPSADQCADHPRYLNILAHVLAFLGLFFGTRFVARHILNQTRRRRNITTTAQNKNDHYNNNNSGANQSNRTKNQSTNHRHKTRDSKETTLLKKITGSVWWCTAKN